MSAKIEHNVETYDIDAELGRDDLTISYSAHRNSDGLPVIVRVLAPQFSFDSFFISRLRDVVTRSMKLSHPNIVEVYEVQEKDDIVYIVREFVEADSLANYLKKHGPIPPMQTLELVRQLASALDYAHAQGVKHGDLSDHNIFLNAEQVWVTDFSLLMAADGTSLAKKGFAVGNPAYLSPERVKGTGSSRIADLYALGIITYQMLSGRVPFSGETSAILHAQVYEPPPPLEELNPQVSQTVSNVVLRMLAKGLELRYRTGEEFVAALQASIEASPAGKRSNGTAPVRPVAKSRLRIPKQLVWGTLILVPAIVFALVIGFWLTSQWLNGTPQSSEPLTTTNNTQPQDLTPVPLMNRQLPQTNDVSPETSDNSGDSGGSDTPSAGTASESDSLNVSAATTANTLTPTSVPPTARLIPSTDTPAPPTLTPIPPTETPVPPTSTAIPPTATSVPPTATPIPPTATPVPPTSTAIPSTTTPIPPTATSVPPTATPIPPTSTAIPSTATPVPPTATPVPVTATAESPAGTPTETPLITETPALTPTVTSVPSGPVIVENSPFSNLLLTRAVNSNSQPVNPTDVFSASRAPIYLFFDYEEIETGTVWQETWRRADQVIRQTQQNWPQAYGEYGTAWVFYTPASGFSPGPYTIELSIEGEVMASIGFTVQ